MAKKQNPDAIYREQERITADLSAWSITKNGEQVARIIVKYGGRNSPHGLTVHAVRMGNLAGELLAWMDYTSPEQISNTLRDAIRQATKLETIEWLAAIAERYGFKRPCQYCQNGQRTGLPGNACENCMNTGFQQP